MTTTFVADFDGDGGFPAFGALSCHYLMSMSA